MSRQVTSSKLRVTSEGTGIGFLFRVLLGLANLWAAGADPSIEQTRRSESQRHRRERWAAEHACAVPGGRRRHDLRHLERYRDEEREPEL